MAKAIYDIRDLENAGDAILAQVDKALLATAFNYRDQCRRQFIKEMGQLKYHTEEGNTLAEGIMVGRLNKDHTVKVHAMGSYEKYNTFKTRFFVGGTTYRKGVSQNGNEFTKGYIGKMDTLRRGMEHANVDLERYINNAIENI